MDIKLINSLLKSDLFSDFEEKELSVFLNQSHYKIESYRKSDIVALRGDKCNNLMLVVKGNLIARMVAESGKFIQIDKIGEGRIIAPAMLFATDNVFPVDVTPEHDTDILVMKKEVFLSAMQLNNKLLFNFIQIISNTNRFLSNKIHFLSLKSLRGKVAEYLLSESKLQGSTDTISIGMTRQELADKFGVSRQSLVRTLSELEHTGLLQISDKKITILNRRKLELED